MLSDISLRLKVAMAATVVCGAALKSQNADSDEDAAVVLQRCVADELDRPIERRSQSRNRNFHRRRDARF